MNLRVDLEVRPEWEEQIFVALAPVERCLKEAAKVEKVPPAEVSVTVVGDREIHQLNWEYRQVDRATDVLSFPQWAPGEKWNIGGDIPLPLGDIVISLPRAQEQARRFGHTLERELGFLAVHGFLHLLGYDHGDEQAERDMFSRQEEILSRVGLKRQE